MRSGLRLVDDDTNLSRVENALQMAAQQTLQPQQIQHMMQQLSHGTDIQMMLQQCMIIQNQVYF